MTALDSATAANADVRFVPADGGLPWAEFPGGKIRLLRADFATGEWVVHNIFDPGFTAPKHKHTGQVDAYTIRGAWLYLEYGVPYTAGSYVHEPALSVHTLHVPADNEGPTEVIFVMRGANLNLDDAGNVISITDAETTLQGYTALCEMQGLGTPAVLR
jgi:2,4'-dihydroxyacetophenone dioxygenase